MKNINTKRLNSTKTIDSSNTPSLKQQFRFDLTMRARGGIFIYLAVWLMTSIWSGIIHTNPFAFYLNTLLIVVIGTMRIVHYALCKHLYVETQLMHFGLIFLILFSALHWGVLSAWVIFASSVSSLYYPYMIILSAFALGGTAILSISSIIKKYYPLLMFLPTVVTGVIIGDEENYILATLMFFALIYIFEATKFSQQDYWNAIINHRRADIRAKRMKELSITDQLTGLHNRLHFNNQFNHEWKRCRRLKSAISILMIDLDHFKQINDTYGHAVGDECLKKVADILRAEIKRDTDVAARYGGEEFIVILPDTNLDFSCRFAENLVKNISKIKFKWNNETINMSCSIGLASIVPEKKMDSQSLIKAADQTMYKAKNQGRNRYCIFNKWSST